MSIDYRAIVEKPLNSRLFRTCANTEIAKGFRDKVLGTIPLYEERLLIAENRFVNLVEVRASGFATVIVGIRLDFRDLPEAFKKAKDAVQEELNSKPKHYLIDGEALIYQFEIDVFATSDKYQYRPAIERLCNSYYSRHQLICYVGHGWDIIDCKLIEPRLL